MPEIERIKLLDLYRYMFICRESETRMIELYRQGRVKGTVLTGEGNEAAITALISGLDHENDVCNLMQRDFAGYLVWGVSLHHLFSHYIANADSITEGKDGNVHHGMPEKGLLPMISHLGAMLPNVVGAVYARRKRGMNTIGAAIVGDGGTSTGDVHEAMNIASVMNIPIIFFIENNQWAYSTPNRLQFKEPDLTRRAKGYGIRGRRIKAVDVAECYEVFSGIIEEVRSSGEPYIIQADTYRFPGHAAYDTADYVRKEERDEWRKEDPLLIGRRLLLDAGYDGEDIENRESEWSAEVASAANDALRVRKIEVESVNLNPYADTAAKQLPPLSMDNVTPVQAINAALKLSLENDKDVFLLGEDIAVLGGPFKTTKGLFEQFGRDRVIDMPLAESGFTGFAAGAAEMGMRPVVEMQFSDFSTDAVTQIGVNSGTYYFRTGRPLPLTIRMPTGGGLSYGPFHSQDLEGLYAGFPGLKIVYPSFPQDFFNLLLSSIYDDNPVLVFESKYLHRRLKGNIRFDGKVKPLDGPRIVRPGTDVTIFSYGAMLHETLEAAERAEDELNISAEVIDGRVLKPLDRDVLLESVKRSHRLLIVQESWQCCGIGPWIISMLMEEVFFELDAPPLVYSPPDTPVPFAPELETWYRPNADGIVERLRKLQEF